MAIGFNCARRCHGTVIRQRPWGRLNTLAAPSNRLIAMSFFVCFRNCTKLNQRKVTSGPSIVGSVQEPAALLEPSRTAWMHIYW
jgi:hypothetical protein